jgi:hypothetical protein
VEGQPDAQHFRRHGGVYGFEQSVRANDTNLTNPNGACVCVANCKRSTDRLVGEVSGYIPNESIY